jgi:hypothetical protein
MLNQSRSKQNSGATMSSQKCSCDFQKPNAAIRAARIDKYEIASGEIPSRTQRLVAASAVRRNIRAIDRRDVGSYLVIFSGFR